MDSEMILEKFKEGLSKDLSKFIDRKGKFSYLSWAFAVSEFQRMWPECNFGCLRWDGIPYCRDDSGAYVTVWVTRFPGDDVFEFSHPVLDNTNKPIKAPTAFDVNTAYMRGLTKAIGIRTGLGLSLYAGEDIPKDIVGDRKADEATVSAWLDFLGELLSIEEYVDDEGNAITTTQYPDAVELLDWAAKIKDPDIIEDIMRSNIADFIIKGMYNSDLLSKMVSYLKKPGNFKSASIDALLERM